MKSFCWDDSITTESAGTFLKCGYRTSELRHRKNTDWRFYTHKLFCGWSTSSTSTLLDSAFFTESSRIYWRCAGNSDLLGGVNINGNQEYDWTDALLKCRRWDWPLFGQRSASTGHVIRKNLQSPRNMNNFRNRRRKRAKEAFFWLLISSYSKRNCLRSGWRTSKKMGVLYSILFPPVDSL